MTTIPATSEFNWANYLASQTGSSAPAPGSFIPLSGDVTKYGSGGEHRFFDLPALAPPTNNGSPSGSVSDILSRAYGHLRAPSGPGGDTGGAGGVATETANSLSDFANAVATGIGVVGGPMGLGAAFANMAMGNNQANMGWGAALSSALGSKGDQGALSEASFSDEAANAMAANAMANDYGNTNADFGEGLGTASGQGGWSNAGLASNASEAAGISAADESSAAAAASDAASAAAAEAAAAGNAVGDQGGFGNDAGDGGGGGGGGGGSVICTELHRRGILSDAVYAADQAEGQAQPAEVVAGYHAWAIPYTRLMRRSSIAFAVGRWLGTAWAHEMAARRGVAEAKSSRLGRFLVRIGPPMCRAIAALITKAEVIHA